MAREEEAYLILKARAWCQLQKEKSSRFNSICLLLLRVTRNKNEFSERAKRNMKNDQKMKKKDKK